MSVCLSVTCTLPVLCHKSREGVKGWQVSPCHLYPARTLPQAQATLHMLWVDIWQGYRSHHKIFAVISCFLVFLRYYWWIYAIIYWFFLCVWMMLHFLYNLEVLMLNNALIYWFLLTFLFLIMIYFHQSLEVLMRHLCYFLSIHVCW